MKFPMGCPWCEFVANFLDSELARHIDSDHPEEMAQWRKEWIE